MTSKAIPIHIPNIDIRPDHWQIVRDILRKHVPRYEVWAFGSRAKWTAKDYSDLDLCIQTDRPLDFKTLALLQEDFAESDLPWKVDIVDGAVISEVFRKIIERDRVGVQKADSPLELPPPEIRREAAKFLVTLDDRIENLRQINATLEAIAVALFKSRFVDFDGVAAEDRQGSEQEDARIENNEMQMRTLAALRDTLLPRLISGRLRVKEAERRAEECRP
jgi:predicted nucleotidyltransferase